MNNDDFLKQLGDLISPHGIKLAGHYRADADQVKRVKDIIVNFVKTNTGNYTAKASYVGVPAIFQLELCCKQLNRAYGEFGCYLVGSALERPDWRDVDVVFIMENEEFYKEFPGTKKQNWEFDERWLILTIAISNWLSKQTGLPIDFKFQPQFHANEQHMNKPRHALGLELFGS